MNKGLTRAIGVMIEVRCIRRCLDRQGFDDKSNPFIASSSLKMGLLIGNMFPRTGHVETVTCLVKKNS